MESITTSINRGENEMAVFRKKYARGMEMRNQIGLMLVNRNDELCALLERDHMQKKSLDDGVVHLKRKDDEVRVLRLQVRRIAHCRV